MNRFEREYTDGVGDGLSIALRILRQSRDLDRCAIGITEALVLAREVKERDTIARLKEMVAAVPPWAEG
ncbi:MAG: hypothetical protein ACYDFT_00245 [Thermoplasmata archaeon]